MKKKSYQENYVEKDPFFTFKKWVHPKTGEIRIYAHGDIMGGPTVNCYVSDKHGDHLFFQSFCKWGGGKTSDFENNITNKDIDEFLTKKIGFRITEIRQLLQFIEGVPVDSI